MLVKRMMVGSFGVNCYILSCKKTKKAAVIDPGQDPKKIMKYLKDQELDLSFVLLTHAHGDHIGGVLEIKNEMNVPVFIHEQDSLMLQDKSKNLSELICGFPVEVNADKLLSHGENVQLGDLKLEIIHTPGHSPGSISIKVENCIFTGDTLFEGSIGRTDLEGGSFDEIINSIKEKLLIFEDHSIVLPGHGEKSTIGKERKINPFLK